MEKYFVVILGAGIGGGVRYWVSNFVYKYLPVFFPYGTLIVNIIGSFLLGILIYGFDEKEMISLNLKLFLGVGFCGGLTTFSTFSFETLNLVKDAQFTLAVLNVLLNVIVSFIGIYFAYIITR